MPCMPLLFHLIFCVFFLSICYLGRLEEAAKLVTPVKNASVFAIKKSAAWSGQGSLTALLALLLFRVKLRSSKML